MVKELTEHLMSEEDYEEAQGVVNRNMSKGYSAHNQLIQKIQQAEIKFLPADGRK